MSCEKKNGYLYSCTVNHVPVSNHMLSCTPPGPSGQVTGALEGEVHAHAQAKLGIHGETTCEYIHPVKLVHASEDNEWLQRKMASNCAPNFNPSSAKHVNTYTCTYSGTGLDEDGNVIERKNKHWKGHLVSCDDSSMKIGDDVMRDIQKYVYYRAGGDDAKLDVSKFDCEVMSLPM